MKKDSLRQAAVLLAVLACITVNGLANALPFNGQTTGEISDRFAVYFVPAGYVFAIWGLIYVGLLAFGIYQALPAQRENSRLKGIAYLSILSSAANAVWIFFWHYEYFVPTVLVMVVLLLTLIAIYLRLRIGSSPVTTVEKWCVQIPFSIYLGWITVATVANVTAVLSYLRWNGWGIAPANWAVIMLLVSALVGGLVSRTRRDVTYVLVIVWAFIGIAVKHQATSIVAIPAAMLALILALSLIPVAPRRR